MHNASITFEVVKGEQRCHKKQMKGTSACETLPPPSRGGPRGACLKHYSHR